MGKTKKDSRQSGKNRDSFSTKKGDRSQLSNYRLLSIAPTMSRFLGAIFSHQLRPILEYHYGPEQHGFRKGHSTVSLLHILETVIHTSTQNKKEVAIVQIDVAKAFDKVHRTALRSFADNIIQGWPRRQPPL